jgi:hypothetical protein
MSKRAKKIEKAQKLVWASLKSHLPYTYGKTKDGTNKFHRKCVREYVELLKILSELY